MRKLLAMILCLLMVCSFAACGQNAATTEESANATGTGADATESVPAEEVVDEENGRLTASVVFGHNLTAEQVDMLNHRLETFYARFPGVKVVFRELEGEITPDNVPTVMICDTDQIPGYVHNNMLMPLDSWIDTRSGIVIYADGNMGQFGLTEAEKEDLVPLYYEESKQIGGDVTWSLPFMRQAMVMYFNGTFFSENNLPETFITWDDVFESCREIKAMDPDSIPLAIADVDELFLSLCVQKDIAYNADEWKSVFGEEAMAIVKELNALYQEGCLMVADENTDLAEIEGQPRHYMIIGSTERAADLIPEKDQDAYAYEVRVMTLGRYSDENPKVLTFGKDLVVCTADDDDLLTAAWMLVKYMCTDPAFQGGLAADMGFLPVLSSPANPGSGEFSDYLDRADESVGLPALAALTTQDQDPYYFTAPAFAGSAQIRQQLDALVKQCLTFTGDVDTQIAEAFEVALTACAQ